MCDDAVERDRVVPEVHAYPIAREKKIALVLIQLNPLAKLRHLLVGGKPQIPFDAEMAEKRGRGAVADRVEAASRVGGARGDVRAHELQGDQLVRPAVHHLAFERINAVRYPHAVRALKDAEVNARTTR